MAVNPSFTTVIQANIPYYRITSVSFRTTNQALHKKVVDGQGAKKNPSGGRYNYPGAITVYLADTLETSLAERMYYFHREVLRSFDLIHLTGTVVLPPFSQTFVLWVILLKKAITQVCDLSVGNAPGLNVIPSLMLNPSQDYWHLKQRRADIESLGYSGLKAPSSRSTTGGHVVTLFADQTKNLQSISPFDATFRLIKQPPPPGPFVNHATELLDFFAGEVQITGTPSGNPNYNAFARVPFHH